MNIIRKANTIYEAILPLWRKTHLRDWVKPVKSAFDLLSTTSGHSHRFMSSTKTFLFDASLPIGWQVAACPAITGGAFKSYLVVKTETTFFQKCTSHAWRLIPHLKQTSMKKLILSIIIITALFGCDSNNNVSNQNIAYDINLSALEVVNKRMEFYNLHDFEKFIQLYDNNVKIYTYPDKLLGTGTDNISSIFEPKFASKSIQVQIVSQMNNGNYTINHEIVTENGIDTKYVSIYEVRDGLIKSVKFVRDN